jgi:hypothetical protein
MEDKDPIPLTNGYYDISAMTISHPPLFYCGNGNGPPAPNITRNGTVFQITRRRDRTKTFVSLR